MKKLRNGKIVKDFNPQEFNISIDELKQKKLNLIAIQLQEDAVILGVDSLDEVDYSNGLLNSQKKKDVEAFFRKKKKHADMRDSINSALSSEDLDALDWDTYKRSFLWLFKFEY